MYEILKKINDKTLVVIKENKIYVAKEAGKSDIPVYKELCKIRNPNLVKIYGTTIIEDRLYAIEEYINGKTLEEYQNEFAPLSNEEIMEIALQICNGLEDIHKKKLVHRDLTPSNIMITYDGVVKIIDFGITRISDPNKAKDTVILGTPGYAAPEQFGFSQTTNKSDIYAVGVLLNYLKTGKLPNEEPTTGFLGKIIDKCIRIDENKRYRDIFQLKKALQGKRNRKTDNFILPGFRQRKWWHMLTAGLYYLTVIFMMAMMTTTSGTIHQVIAWDGLLFFILFVPVLIIFDYIDWSKRWSFTKNKSKAFVWVMKILLCLLSFIMSIVCLLTTAEPVIS